MASAQAEFESDTYVKAFVKRARGAQAAGRLHEMEAYLTKARALDPQHPEIATFGQDSISPTPPEPTAEVEPQAEFPGNPSLDQDVQDRVWSTFQQTLELVTQGKDQEALVGSEFHYPHGSRFPSGKDFDLANQRIRTPRLDRRPHDREPLRVRSARRLRRSGWSGGSGTDTRRTDARPDSEDGPEADNARIDRLLDEGQKIYERGDYQEAIDVWSRIFLIDIDNLDASNRIEEARKWKAEVERAEKLFHEGVAQIERGATAEGLSSFRKALELVPDHSLTREYLDQLGADQVPADERADEAEALVDLEARVKTLEQELAEVRRQLQESSRWPQRFRDLQRRVERVSETAPSEVPPAWLDLSSEQLRERLTERGFFLSQEVTSSLWSALRRKRIVVLEGVPGTGKSVLAKLLPEILLEPHPQRGSCFSEVNVHPDLSVEEFVAPSPTTIASARPVGLCSTPSCAATSPKTDTGWCWTSSTAAVST